MKRVGPPPPAAIILHSTLFNLLHQLDDGAPGDVLEIQEFRRFAGFGLLGHRQGIDLHRVGGQGRHDRLADAAGGIMVFHGDQALGGLGGCKQGGRVHRLDAVEVDDPDVDALLL